MQGLTTKFELTNERADLISLKALNFKHSRRNSFQFFDLFSAVFLLFVTTFVSYVRLTMPSTNTKENSGRLGSFKNNSKDLGVSWLAVASGSGLAESSRILIYFYFLGNEEEEK